MRSPPLLRMRSTALAVSIDEPPPTATTASKGPSARARSIAASRLASVGSTWAESWTTATRPARAHGLGDPCRALPVASTPASVTTRTRVAPSAATSWPISSTAPAAELERRGAVGEDRLGLRWRRGHGADCGSRGAPAAVRLTPVAAMTLAQMPPPTDPRRRRGPGRHLPRHASCASSATTVRSSSSATSRSRPTSGRRCRRPTCAASTTAPPSPCATRPGAPRTASSSSPATPSSRSSVTPRAAGP